MDFSKLNVKTLDRTKLDKGVHLEYQDGIFFDIRRNGNPEYRAAIAEAWANVDTETLTNDAATVILERLAIEHCVVGWSGLEMDGATMQFSKEYALELLLAPEAEEIKDWIVQQSENIENFRSENQKK